MQGENQNRKYKVSDKFDGQQFKCTSSGYLGHELDKYMRKNSICYTYGK